MSYILNIIVAIIGIYLIANSAIEMSDTYRRTHPHVELLTFGEKITPRLFVKGVLSFTQSQGAMDAVLDWSGEEIRLKPTMKEKVEDEK